MKRRGFLDPLPRARRARILPVVPPRLAQHVDFDVRVWEDEAAHAEDSAVAASTIIQEDVEPQPDDTRNLRQISSNLMGVHFETRRYNGNGENDEDDDYDNGDNDDSGEDDQSNLKTAVGGDLLPDSGLVHGREDLDHLLTVSGGSSSPDPPDPPPGTPEPLGNLNIIPVPGVESQEVVADGPNNKYQDTCGEEFHLALMLFVTSADLSVSQYEALAEVLALATTETLRSLPKSIKTLRERCRKSFPLMQIKGKLVDIELQSIPPKKETPRYAYYFDPSEYCSLWLSSPSMRASIHQGMGEFVDSAVELWHGDAWMESVRSTSGRFPFILENNGRDRVVLLPSDCVVFKEITGRLALGRVKCIGIDRRNSSSTQGRECALINRLIPPNLLPIDWLGKWNDRIPQPDDGYPLSDSLLPELVLMEPSREIIPCAGIMGRVWVHFTDQNIHELQASLLPFQPAFCVRYIAYNYNGQYGIRSVHKRHRVLAEIELQELTREYVLKSLVSAPPAGSTTVPPSPAGSTTVPLQHISIPYSAFLDGFGLYRNAYYSLKGMYITPAGMDVYNRTRLYNMYVLMIGPFGSDEDQMAGCLQLNALPIGQGRQITLDSGEQVFVTAFPLLLTGDMPQQNQNSGNKTHKAEFGCRSCFVPEVARHNLQYNIVDSGRYRQHIQFLYKGATSARTKAGREKSLQKLGLSAGGPYFDRCYTMMDPQRATPNDPMHAELRLCKYFAEALLEGILSAEGIKVYRAAWNVVEVPYRWGQPQNPVSHKGSMVFNEHGKVATINPFILMHMFTNDDWTYHHGTPDLVRVRNSYIKKGVDSRLRREFADEIEEWPSGGCTGGIVKTAWALSRCVCLTLQENLNVDERAGFRDVVVSSRSFLQKIFACASSEKKTFKGYSNVPNVHLALHYLNDIENYGTARNSSTMMGEQKHKIFKMHASHTNSKDADLQLMKATNTLQTVRFLLDGAFKTSTPAITKQLREVVQKCPTLRSKFLGAKMFGQEESDDNGHPSHGIDNAGYGIDVSQSLFRNARTGRPITWKSVPLSDSGHDKNILRKVYREEYDVELHPNTQLKVRYWGYFSGDPAPEVSSKTAPQFSVKVSNFSRLRGEQHCFHRVVRIFTASVGTMTRVFFVLVPILRASAQENPLSPYQVYQEPSPADTTCVVVGIRKIEPTVLHFVTKGEGSWWYNPYVPNFL